MQIYHKFSKTRETVMNDNVRDPDPPSEINDIFKDNFHAYLFG